MLRRSLALVAALLAFSTPAYAWNAIGHQVIALLAYERVTPAAKAKLDAILAADPQHRTLQDAAIWPDVHRDHPTWHYVNIPIRPGGPPGRIPPGENVITAIKLADDQLKDASLSAEERADALSNLIHFIGDVHQPLHAVARFTEQTPSGDRGGNLFLLRGRYKNLHQLWDNALNLSGRDRDPKAYVSDLEQEWPTSRLKVELARRTPEDWAQRAVMWPSASSTRFPRAAQCVRCRTADTWTRPKQRVGNGRRSPG